MARDWPAIFGSWAQAPSQTEQQKADNAANMIKDALKRDPSLAGRNFDVYPSGSYRNNTNVRLDSDVDIAVVSFEAMFTEYPLGGPLTDAVLGLTGPAKYGVSEFRDDVERALKAKFGNGVKPGDKAFDIHENSYRLDADIATFLEHRRYTGQRDALGNWLYYSGVEMRPRTDPNKRIINWHREHYEQGTKRNDATGRRFKRITRILKRLRNEMLEGGTPDERAAANATASFLIECLVFNAKDACFNRDVLPILFTFGPPNYFTDVREVIFNMWNRTKADQDVHEMVEVSGMKRLFGPDQPWSVATANEFLLRAWQYVGFK